MGIKNADCYAYFESVKKCKKSHAKKGNSEKGTEKNGVFYFYYCVQMFSPYNFFLMTFFAFKLNIEFCVYYIHIEFS